RHICSTVKGAKGRQWRGADIPFEAHRALSRCWHLAFLSHPLQALHPRAMSTPTGILSITTSGIQDVSGFLPLLGTEQCEIHVSCALERGFFYAAGSPMSIFGSLGIVKAGFTALWISLDRLPFHGPRQLRNAGFNPKGVTDMLSYALDVDNSIYTAEHKMRTILRRHDCWGSTWTSSTGLGSSGTSCCCV
ncbi:hypothetical protein B0H13DRAFT_2567717, partial [Mycena leptocephala]